MSVYEPSIVVRQGVVLKDMPICEALTRRLPRHYQRVVGVEDFMEAIWRVTTEVKT